MATVYVVRLMGLEKMRGQHDLFIERGNAPQTATYDTRAQAERMALRCPDAYGAHVEPREV